MNLFKSLYIQVLVAVIFGILLGMFVPDVAIHFKHVADIFVKIIKMLIGPIVFLTLVSGIAAMHDWGEVSKLAGGALIFFLFTTTFALVLGLITADYFKPGVGLNIDPSTLDVNLASTYIGKHQASSSVMDMILNIIPNTFVGAFTEGEMLQIIFIALFFALGLMMMGEHGRPIVQGMQTLSKVFFNMIHVVMHFAPVAAGSAMAFSIAKFGLSPLSHLMGLVACYYVTGFAFIVILFSTLLRWYSHIPMAALLRFLKDELLIVWSTGSSETVLPNLMEKLEQLGCKPSVVGLVLPLGYSFNLAGTAIYLTMAALFIAQATNTQLTMTQELVLLCVMIISSKGAAGVTGSGFIILASSLATLNQIPAAGVVLILGVDKFLNEGRALVNVISNAMATIIISTWQKSFDHQQALDVLGLTSKERACATST